MKTALIALLLACTALSALGQFFSEEEKTRKTEEQLRTNLPEAEQKEIFIAVNAAQATAFAKANQLHPVKIHHTPKQRAARKDKAKKTQATLFDHYKDELAKERKISRATLAKIMDTGRAKGWPTKKEEPPDE